MFDEANVFSFSGVGLVGMITTINESDHTVTVSPFSSTEPIVSVPLFRNPGNYSLPSRGDIVVIFFDTHGKPMIVGGYPKFVVDTIQTKKDYFLQEGEVLIQTERGGRFMMLNSGMIRLVNWIDQGIEIDEPSGSIVFKSHSRKDVFAGIVERSGYVRRKGVATIGSSTYNFDLDNLESVLRKSGSLDVASTISDSIGTELHEKRIEIKAPGSQTDSNPDGKNIFEDTVGHVVNSNSQEVLHTDSSLPLRRKTTYFDSSGITEIMREEIDVKGNVHIFINSGASQGIKIDALVKLIADFLNVDITATQNIKLSGSQKVELLSGSNTLDVSPTGVTITVGINTVTINSTGVTITAGVNTAIMTPASIILTTGANILTMTPASFTFTNPVLSGTSMIWT